MSDCVFCRIIAGELPAERVYEDDHVMVIRDRQPRAPVHLLALPRTHVPTLNEASPDLVGRLFAAAQQVAQRLEFADTGYRTVINVQAGGGQTVWHLHLHVLAGRTMQWPPG